MQRVEAAIRSHRCVLAIGGKLLQSPDVVMELRRRSVPAVALSGEPVHPVQPLNAETIAPALSGEGGIIVLVEPETGGDARGLNELAEALKGAANKPRLFVAARAFNPFALPMGLRLLKFEHLKLRARDFLGQLSLEAPAPAPTPAARAPAAASDAQPSKDAPKAPRPTFIGREAELAALKEHLSTDGGPILVHGPKGVGRRWLVEKAISDSGLERLPDLLRARRRRGHPPRAHRFDRRSGGERRARQGAPVQGPPVAAGARRARRGSAVASAARRKGVGALRPRSSPRPPERLALPRGPPRHGRLADPREHAGAPHRDGQRLLAAVLPRGTREGAAHRERRGSPRQGAPRALPRVALRRGRARPVRSDPSAHVRPSDVDARAGDPGARGRGRHRRAPRSAAPAQGRDDSGTSSR